MFNLPKFRHPKTLKYIICVLGVLLSLSFRLSAQNISNEGTDFWAVFPTHDPNSTSTLANMNIFITSKSISEVTVSCGTYSETKTIPANTSVPFAVPRDVSYIRTADANTKLPDRGIRIKVTPGKAPVAAYAHVYAGARSAATLLLPFEALGQKYYSMNYQQDNNGRNFLALVAADDNTTLMLTEKSGVVRTITLEKAGDVYEYLAGPNEDLTGVLVQVDPVTSQCKRFAAFSGSTSTTISCGSSRDPLLQQLYTTSSWGKNYGVAPFVERRSILRILAQEDNTRVNIDGVVTILNQGSYLETEPSAAAKMVSADKLISVAQFSLTQNCSRPDATHIIGDPDMIMLNPIEFSIKKITLFSSDRIAIQERFINIVMKTESRASFRINGTVPNSTWQVFPSNPQYSYSQISVYQESITISANDGFNAMAYGFGTAESYGYSAGTSLASNQYINVISKLTQEEQSNACIDQTVSPKITMPFVLTRVIWTFGDDNSIYEDTAPVPVPRVVNGQTLYDYYIPVEKTYTVLGQQVIKATGYFSNEGNSCFIGSADFEFIFSVDPYPTANFEIEAASCAKTEIKFKDLSVTNAEERVLKKWLWDFGDGTTSSLQNPTHVYSAAGPYTVKLMTASESGCYSDVFTKIVEVHELPQVAFSTNPTVCEQRAVNFTNQSTSADGEIASLLWDFGDGSTSTDANPFHTYTKAGTYNIKLTVTTTFGCVSNLEKSLKVNELPTLDFELPVICANDGPAVFTNLSSITTGEGLVYTWDFGDAEASLPQSNTSSEIHGRHQYTKPGIYKVKLSATSAAGCTTSVEKQFQVNGTVPIANFEVLNEKALCSANPLVFKDLASVDYGEISRIEWYFDYESKNTPDIVDESPSLRSEDAKLYSFSYPVFSNISHKTYKVMMRVFSGTNCVQEKQQEITITALPELDFGNPVEICQEADGIKLLVSEKNGLIGKSNFSGTGVSKDGLFIPSVAGIGVHTITYSYQIGEGCVSEVSQQVTVLATPVLNVGPDLEIYEGDGAVLQATANGTGLSYKWFPSAGLDRDDVLNPRVTPTEDMVYKLTVTTAKGCTNTDEVKVKLLRNLEVPSAISPNGDGINDVWNIKHIDIYPNATVELFDRSGRLLFRSRGYQAPFDGTFNGAQVPIGVYYYIINLNKGRKPKTGTLTIIK